MKKIIFSFIILAVFIGALFRLGSRTSNAPEETPEFSASFSVTASPTVQASTPFSQILEITITAGGLSSQKLTIKAGDTVKFTNFDQAPHWPASGPHPAHTQCQGLDALRGLIKGESYFYTFTRPQVCSFHDHINANRSEYNGTIIVK